MSGKGEKKMWLPVKFSMVSETDIKSIRKSTSMVKAESLPTPSGSALKNTLVMLGIVMIIVGYGFAGYLVYKRLRAVEQNLLLLHSSVEKESIEAPPRLIQFCDPQPEQDPEPEVEAEPEPEPEPGPKKRNTRRAPKKIPVSLDSIVASHTVADGSDTLVPSDDL